MNPIITAFKHSPDRGRGLARDTRVRWAFEEVGQPYDVRFLTFEELKQPTHLERNPFGQIPTYEKDGLTLFESGAIVLHIAETHGGLLPKDANGRIRAIMWMFAALNSIEPSILEHVNARILEKDKPWAQERLPIVTDRIRAQLKKLSAHLGGSKWLDGEFSAGDLMMICVLIRLRVSNILEEFPSLDAYVARGEARPAYKRAFEAQLEAFTNNSPG